MIRSKKRALGLFTLVAVPVIFASAAFACQALTTARARPSSGPVGTQVTVTGGGYDRNFPVQIRWDSRYATPLATAQPNQSGFVSAVITVPNSSVGSHTILITQKVRNSAGQWVDKSGSPGRCSFEVTAGAASSASTGLDPSVLVTPVGLAGLLLMVAVSRRPRRRTEAA
ncbi:MAG TPA: hypothetical protein VHG90_12690 [Acidimicrobiales bacterium]|nr:hypothetical protein [Acidimicrobiales bacterium]